MVIPVRMMVMAQMETASWKPSGWLGWNLLTRPICTAGTATHGVMWGHWSNVCIRCLNIYMYVCKYVVDSCRNYMYMYMYICNHTVTIARLHVAF